MTVMQWAIKHGIPLEAVNELKQILGTAPPDVALGSTGESEAAIQTRVRIEATKKGGRLWRNNVGACVDERGNFIRYGLANDSKRLNEVFKSSDLIGLQPVLITNEMVGHTIGQFVAREVKAGGWTFSGTKREAAQLKFIELVNSLGGDAKFIN